MTTTRKELTPEWIEKTASESRVFGIVWRTLGIIPSDISRQPDKKTFDVTLPCLPTGEKLEKLGNPETALRQAMGKAVNATQEPLGYFVGNFSVVKPKVTHPTLTG